MSDRLALSASMSVLMMALYVLFGSAATRVDLGPGAFASPVSPVSIAAPAAPLEPARLLPLAR